MEIDFSNNVIRAAPIAGAGVVDGVSNLIFGYSLNEWFYIVAIAYTLVQIIDKACDVYKKHKPVEVPEEEEG